MRRNLVLALLATLFVVGCSQEPPPPPEEAPPPPPTAEEIHRELTSAFSLFQQTANKVGGGISPSQKDQTIAGLRQSVSKFRNTPNGPEGIDMARKDLERLTKNVEDGDQRWLLLKACIEAHHVLAPTSSKYGKLEERVDLMLARPRVILRGWMTIDRIPHAFLEVVDRDSKEVTTYKIQEGEDFHDVLRLLRIIGDNQAVELLYKPVDEPWIVRQPRDAYEEIQE